MIAAAAGLAGAVGAGKSAFAQTAGDLPEGGTALTQVMPAPPPVLRFTDAAGRKLGLGAFGGHGLLVNFWATWCGPCVAELPSLVAIAPVLAQAGILVLPISIDLTGAQAVRPFFASHGITGLPILLDPQGGTLDALNAQGIPVTIIIDPAGRLVARYDGAANWNTPDTIKTLRGLAGGGPRSHPQGGVQQI